MSFVKPVVLGLMAITADLICQPVYAQEGFPAPSPEIIVWSARACYAEATWSIADCTALLHVIRKRATKSNWPFLKMLKQYSASNWLKSRRGKQMSTLTLASNKNQTEQWNQNWRQLVSHVMAVLTDTVSDPCPRADHWAATYYVPKSPMRRVRCTEKVANAFWVSVRG
ncbi:MAG TPA: hypothetical protein VFG30_42870 [Polyangiales bacterium]|jgi:hypothetical protein|nr:hypothetical protein [Polyangiales bacterium]